MPSDIDECVEMVSHSFVKLQDRKSKRVLVVDNKAMHVLAKVKMDGCVIKQSVCADWLLSKKGVGDLVVELKGSDVSRALEQVYAVAQYLEDNGMRQGKLGAFILCSRFPKVDSTILRLRNQFARRYSGSPLHITSRSVRVNFEEAVGRHGANLSPHF